MNKNENVRSAVDFRNVSENFGAEILNDLNLVKNVGQQYVTQNFIPEKAGKGLEGILLNKIVPELCALSLHCCPLFLWPICGKSFLFLMDRP